MTTSGVLSQKLSTNSADTRSINTVQRDSIFLKIQRGKIDAAKVVVLKKALSECGESKKIYVEVIETHKMKADSLYLIIDKQDIMASNVKDINEANMKEQKKKVSKAFIKGGLFGIVTALVTLAVTVFL